MFIVEVSYSFSILFSASTVTIIDIHHFMRFDITGRAGRLGRKGLCMSMITSEQEFVLERLANKLGLKLRCIARQQGKKKRARGG
jgi:superfamily II DNA/RNA helicase